MGEEPHQDVSHGVGHDCSWRMLWSNSSRVYVSTCQHEALKYGNLPSKDNALPFSCAYAGTCQHEALKRESFPRQMLGAELQNAASHGLGHGCS